ncbi:phosphotransferase family protein [Nocardioides sp. SYSU DS0651]|uniref:phosphotransferase family protein n=1 Tax=Nocardioides sp. SYSU DS0651 TaxID=3415955 RepID=UPI003F4BDE25
MTGEPLRGRDHAVTDGAGGTVVRRRLADGEGLAVEQEAALLALVAEISPVPVPRVVEVVAATQVLVMERLPGAPLLGSLPDLPVPTARRVGGQLGDLVAALGRVRPERVAAIVPAEPSSLAEHHEDAQRIAAAVRRELPPASVEPVDRFLAAPLPAPARTLRLCHNDLGAEHVFVGSPDCEVTGVIDWSDASLGDPALDLGLVWRDLGDAGFASALARIPADDDERDELAARARFYAQARALEDFEFGLGTGQDAYLHNAARAVERLF